MVSARVLIFVLYVVMHERILFATSLVNLNFKICGKSTCSKLPSTTSPTFNFMALKRIPQVPEDFPEIR